MISGSEPLGFSSSLLDLFDQQFGVGQLAFCHRHRSPDQVRDDCTRHLSAVSPFEDQGWRLNGERLDVVCLAHYGSRIAVGYFASHHRCRLEPVSRSNRSGRRIDDFEEPRGAVRVLFEQLVCSAHLQRRDVGA
ncbi:hypothetical protein DY240_20875 [Jiangella rhizosphaerae]|uniref:Uncharacterized protein n=1 Tax=Jiangella rhizosphaerae TaxID=2293569 RepID=A0A418KLM4_9ACTN|nr:hypothetical protein DY240_20875 [Jiangella rhizosphaerae]